jgi:hypothetical protein
LANVHVPVYDPVTDSVVAMLGSAFGGGGGGPAPSGAKLRRQMIIATGRL